MYNAALTAGSLPRLRLLMTIKLFLYGHMVRCYLWYSY